MLFLSTGGNIHHSTQHLVVQNACEFGLGAIYSSLFGLLIQLPNIVFLKMFSIDTSERFRGVPEGEKVLRSKEFGKCQVQQTSGDWALTVLKCSASFHEQMVCQQHLLKNTEAHLPGSSDDTELYRHCPRPSRLQETPQLELPFAAILGHIFSTHPCDFVRLKGLKRKMQCLLGS